MSALESGSSFIVPIEEPEDAYYAAQQARHLAFELGFSAFDTGLITIAVAELATNVVRYALPGVVTINRIYAGKGIEITVEDHGAGIDDLEAAMVDGFSTHSEPSIGKGLGSAKRSVEEFIVNKTDATGTSITLRHFLRAVEDRIEKMGISFPAVSEFENGDRYLIKAYQADKLLVAVIDGAGVGEYAAKASQCALEVVEAHYRQPLNEIIQTCHDTLRDKGVYYPVQMALLRIEPDRMTFCGVGDLGVKVYAAHSVSFPIQDGSVGMILPKDIHVHEVARPETMTLFLHTDGVELPGDATIARDVGFERACCQLYDQFALSDDDATLVVIRDKL